MKNRVKAGPVSAFLCFFNAAMLACVTNSTNQRGVLRASTAGQPAADWQPVSEATMLSYLGAHMAMDIDVAPILSTIGTPVPTVFCPGQVCEQQGMAGCSSAPFGAAAACPTCGKPPHISSG